jgi:hypothetical protein
LFTAPQYAPQLKNVDRKDSGRFKPSRMFCARLCHICDANEAGETARALKSDDIEMVSKCVATLDQRLDQPDSWAV